MPSLLRPLRSPARSLARSVAFAIAGSAGLASLFVFACSSGDDDGTPPPSSSSGGDGAVDATFAADVLPPLPEAEPPAGDVCGDRAGYEPSSVWPLRGACPTRAGWAGLAGPQSSTIRWIAPLKVGGGGESSPAISANAGILWVGSVDGDIVGVLNGNPRWGYRTGGEVRSSPAMDAKGNAVAGSMDGTLYGIMLGSFAMEDGGVDGASPFPPARLMWSIPLGGQLVSSPVIAADGTIYVGSTNGKLFAITVAANNVASTKWSATTNDVNGSSPALGQDGTVYAGSSDHKLYAFHPDGSPAWSVDLGAEVKASPAVGGEGTVYIGTADGKLHAIDKAGKEKWSYATGGPITGTPAVYAGSVFIGSEDKRLHAISTVSGAKRWIYETQGAVGTPVIASDGVIYVGATDARLYAITAKGSLFFATNVKGNVRGAPAIGTSGDLYVSTDNGIAAVGP